MGTSLSKDEWEDIVENHTHYDKLDEYTFQRVLEQCPSSTYTYTCSTTKCDFETAKQNMKTSAHVKAAGYPNMSRKFVDIISQNDKKFLAKDVQGFVLSPFAYVSSPKPFAVLKNNTNNTNNSVVATIGVLPAEISLQRKIDEKQKRRDVLVGCGMLMGACTILTYMLKR